MLLSTLLLSAAVLAQEPPAPAKAAPQVLTVTPAAAPAPSRPVDDGAIAAGLQAFRARRFKAAQAAFEKASAAEPQSAAAAYYLGYTYYKLGEPSRRMNANKEKARELFAKAFSLDPAFKPAWGR